MTAGNSERYVRLPVAILNDSNLSAGAVRAYAVLLDCCFDGRSVIGLPRLGERLCLSRAQTWRCIRKLEAAGHIKNHDKRKGAPASYELLSSFTDETSSPASSSKNSAEKFQKSTLRSFTDETIPIRNSLNYSLGDENEKERERTQLLNDLLELLRRCPLNGPTAEREMERLARRHQTTLHRLVAHLRYALAKEILEPIKYADRQAGYGADVPALEAVS
jgi:hypothetical protein